jgi:hypothetical protein
MGIEIEYLMMTGNGGPIYSGWRKQDISRFPGLRILRDAAQLIQPGIQRRGDASGHVNVYEFRDGKIMLPDTYTLLETVTSPSMSLQVLRDQLWSMKQALIRAAAAQDGSVVSGAACPLAYAYGDINRRGLTTANNAGMHIHLEAPNDKVKIKLCNMIMQVMPELTALGVNSPIHNRQPTPYRSKRLSTSPLVGPSGVSPLEYEPDNPLQFSNPGDRYQYITPYTKSQRTIELRGFDTPMTIDWAMAIAALIECLAVKASRLFIDEKRNTVVGNNSKIRKANFTAAMTHGLKARFAPDHSFGVKLDGRRKWMSFLYHDRGIDASAAIPATLAVKRLLYYIEAEAYELGLVPYLEPLYVAVRTGRDQAQLQLDWFRQLGFRGMFEELKRKSAKHPESGKTRGATTRQYFTVRQRMRGTPADRVYLSAGGLARIKAREGDYVVVSGPKRAIKVQVAHDRSRSGTIRLGLEEVRLSKKHRNQLGLSMYDPVIVGRVKAIPIVLQRTNHDWTP